jgi:hypothetical protein
LVDRRLSGIAMVDHTDVRGELVFEQACKMGLGGHRVEAALEAVSIGPVRTLAEDQEPRQSGDDPSTRPFRADGVNDHPPLSAALARGKYRRKLVKTYDSLIGKC